ncbi:MAG: Txe/YoeB family addiction module toxin [Chitinophagales bacterium]|nr:Txe/YoeB family addiction module toxin [Chitinophagales bacterium]
MKIIFSSKALDELASCRASQPKSAFKVLELIQDIEKHPFEVMGKPEPLKGNLKGFWSRRITDEHRLVYAVQKDEIHVLTCKYHYENV